MFICFRLLNKNRFLKLRCWKFILVAFLFWLIPFRIFVRKFLCSFKFLKWRSLWLLNVKFFLLIRCNKFIRIIRIIYCFWILTLWWFPIFHFFINNFKCNFFFSNWSLFYWIWFNDNILYSLSFWILYYFRLNW